MAANSASHLVPLPGYKLISLLGRGGFGEVWKVEAPGGIEKAMKFVFGDLSDLNDENSRAAEQELKALDRVKNIRHPYVLSLEQWKVINGQLIIVMELAEKNLWDRFKECRQVNWPGIPREELLSYLMEAAEAIDLMNIKYKVQHLDIKPQNLFLVYNHLKVADFGLAKILEGNRTAITGGVTPVYAGPETFEGFVSRYTDQYSLAIVFQELLTGTRPFNGSNTKQLVMQHLNGVPDLDPLPASDRAIIARALAKQPESRWPTCTDLLKQLKSGGTPPEVVIHSPQPVVVYPSTPVPDIRTEVGPTSAVRNELSRLTRLSPTVPKLDKPSASKLSGKLITPREAAASTPNVQSHLMTQMRQKIVQTVRRTSLGLIPPEQVGSGVLIPALFVGVGNTGLTVLRAIRQTLINQFGPDPLPHVQFLYIDTDPEAKTVATTPGATTALLPDEVLTLPLNRAGYYLQRSGLPSVEQWMPPGLLYQLPREPGSTGGVRAFGRLGLTDHVNLVQARLRTMIEPFLSETTLTAAATRTKLKLRSNRPRAYLFANAGGGTGSGMILDLAYLVRNELRQVGLLQPETIGHLTVPPTDKHSARGLAVANSYATLAELSAYSTHQTYNTQWEANGPPHKDDEPPFTRCNVTQMHQRSDSMEHSRVAGAIARAVYLELFTPTGRVTDQLRGIVVDRSKEMQPIVQATGLYRLSWPRNELLNRSSDMFAQRIIERWTSRDSQHLREPVKVWLDEQWDKRKFDLETVASSLTQALDEGLRESPDRVFDAVIDSLRTRTPGAGKYDAQMACEVLDQLLKLVGKPDEDTGSTLSGILFDRQRSITAGFQPHLDALAVAFLEQPQYRLPGAEEVVNQVQERLNRAILGLEGVRHDLQREVNEVYNRLLTCIGQMTTTGLTALGGRKALASDLIDYLVTYPRKRLKQLVLNATLSVYRGLLSSTPEHVRDLNLCRTWLTTVQSELKPRGETSPFIGPGRMILPHGVTGLDGAADMFLGALASEDILNFEVDLQAAISKRFRSLAHLTGRPMASTEFREFLSEHAFRFLEARLEVADPATVFFRHRGEENPQNAKLICQSFEQAAPDVVSLNGKIVSEFSVIACPPSDDGKRFRALVARLLPDVEFVPSDLANDIVFLRENPRLPICELPQMGEHARAAYDAVATGQHDPHTRRDVRWFAVPAQ